MPHNLVHLVDDEEEVRAATTFLLESNGFTVKSWKSGKAFLNAAPRAQAGCVLLDIRMPEMDGLEVQKRIRELDLDLPIIMFTGHGDVSSAVLAMRAGAVTFLEKPPERDALVQAVRDALKRLDVSDGKEADEQHARRLVAKLSERERDVLNALTRGLPNKFIAYDLEISPRTVEIHRANLMAKLGVRSLSDALRIAFAAGLASDSLQHLNGSHRVSRARE
jgi:two-component system, LuxR family, response regulator FixJ